MYKLSIVNLIISLLSLPVVLLIHGERYVDRTPETNWEAYYQLFLSGNKLLPLSILYILLSVLLVYYVKNNTNYKNPKIWINILAIVVVVLTAAGLIINSGAGPGSIGGDTTKAAPPADSSKNAYLGPGKVPVEPNKQEEWKVFNLLQNLTQDYGYELGVFLYADYDKAKVLLYNGQILSRDDLLSKIVEINRVGDTQHAEEVYLPEGLLEHNFYFKYGDSTNKKHLLGVKHRIDHEQKKMFSYLLIMSKEALHDFAIMQSYIFDYDEALGIIPQGDIPTVIDFTVDVVDDYIVYQDIDGFWKAQDVKTGNIYSSRETEASTDKVLLHYNDAGEYFYILKYLEDDSVLAFNKASNEFRCLPYLETIVQASPLQDIESASFQDMYDDRILLQLSSEEIATVTTAFNGSFHTIAEMIEYPSAYSPGLVLEIKATSRLRVNIYEDVGAEKFIVSYILLFEDARFRVTNYSVQSAELQEFFHASRLKFPGN